MATAHEKAVARQQGRAPAAGAAAVPQRRLVSGGKPVNLKLPTPAAGAAPTLPDPVLQMLVGSAATPVASDPSKGAAPRQENFLIKSLKGLDKLRSVVLSGVNELTDPLVGRDASWNEFKANVGRNYGFGDFLEEESLTTNLPMPVKGALGFVGDVALDPLSYAGGAGLYKSGGQAVARQLVDPKLAAALAAKNVSREAAQEAATVAVSKGAARMDPKVSQALGEIISEQTGKKVSSRAGIYLGASKKPGKYLSGTGVRIPGSEKLALALTTANASARAAIVGSKAGDALARKLGGKAGEAGLTQRMRKGGPDALVAFQELENMKFMARTEKLAATVMLKTLDEVLAPFKNDEDLLTDLRRTIEGDSGAAGRMAARDMDGEVAKVVKWLDDAGSRAHLPKIANYFPRQWSEELRKELQDSFKSGSKTIGPAMKRELVDGVEWLGYTLRGSNPAQIRDEIERIARLHHGDKYVQVFSDKVPDVLAAYAAQIARREAKLAAEDDLLRRLGQALPDPKMPKNPAKEAAKKAEAKQRRDLVKQVDREVRAQALLRQAAGETDPKAAAKLQKAAEKLRQAPKQNDWVGGSGALSRAKRLEMSADKLDEAAKSLQDPKLQARNVREAARMRSEAAAIRAKAAPAAATPTAPSYPGLTGDAPVGSAAAPTSLTPPDPAAVAAAGADVAAARSILQDVDRQVAAGQLDVQRYGGKVEAINRTINKLEDRLAKMAKRAPKKPETPAMPMGRHAEGMMDFRRPEPGTVARLQEDMGFDYYQHMLDTGIDIAEQLGKVRFGLSIEGSSALARYVGEFTDVAARREAFNRFMASLSPEYTQGLKQRLREMGLPDEFYVFRGNKNQASGQFLNFSLDPRIAQAFAPEGQLPEVFRVRRDDVVAVGDAAELELIVRPSAAQRVPMSEYVPGLADEVGPSPLEKRIDDLYREREALERRIELTNKFQQQDRSVAMALLDSAEDAARVAGFDPVAKMQALDESAEMAQILFPADASSVGAVRKAVANTQQLNDTMVQAARRLSDGRNVGEVVDALYRVGRLTGQPGGVLKWYDKANSILKQYMIFSPGFHVRNAMGGEFNNALAGVDAASRLEWSRIWKKSGFGSKVDRLGPDELDIYNKVTSTGTVGQSQAEDVVGTMRSGKSWNPLAQNFRPVKRSYAISQGVEGYLRGALAYDVLKKTGGGNVLRGNVDDAADSVIKFHYDYDDLSGFERGVLKRVMPFYTWTRKNLPLQLEQMAKQPRKYMMYLRLKDNLEGMSEEEGVVPGWFGDLGSIRMPKGLIPGMDKNSHAYWSPDMPFRDVAEFVRPDQPLRGLKMAIGSTTPIIKLPIERWAGKKYFTDQPFFEGHSKAPGSWSVIPGLMQALEVAGLAERGKDGYYMDQRNVYTVEQVVPVLGRLHRLAPSGEGDEYMKQRHASNVLSFWGLGVQSNTPEAQKAELRKRKEALRKSVKKERDLGYVD